MKLSDLVLIGDSEEAREFFAGWEHTQPFLTIRWLSEGEPADMSWVERFGYFYDAWQHKELKIPVEEHMMVMNARGSFMRCPERCLKPAESTDPFSNGD